MKRKSVKIGLISLLSIFFSSSCLLTYADETIDNIRYQASIISQQQAQTIEQLNILYENINCLEQQKNNILAEIDQYDRKLVVTIATIDTIDKEIKNKQQEIKKTGLELQQAISDKNIQYEAMKNRIKFMYQEQNNLNIPSVMIQANSISDVIDKVIYVQKMFKYDRDCLTDYELAINKVKMLQQQYMQQKNDLSSMKRGQQQNKQNLENLKAQALILSQDYDNQISYCTEVAIQYQNLIQQQNEQIYQLQAMEAQAITVEQARIAAAEQAARQAAIAQYIMESNVVQQEQSFQYLENQQFTNDNYTTEDYYLEDTADYVRYDEPFYTDNYSSNSDLGSEIANYATQFVGNPYVWGGTSLTDGADCSGFVQSVFGDYGINLSRTTYTQADQGIPVSYSEMQPGDVINYGFHTAIYLGDNQIVHAADEQHGIIVQDNPAYQPIVTIRRFV